MRCVLIVTVSILTSSLVSAESSTVPADRVYDVVCSRTVSHVVAPVGIRNRARAPRLAVVDSNVRPARARLYLDGRLIGMATDFNGSPDYMYLQPGRYRLEARLGGYQNAVFEIEAEPSCVYVIRHRLERIEGSPKQGRLDRGIPSWALERFFTPADQSPSARRPGGSAPDPGLRPDLFPAAGEPSGSQARGALRIHVLPPLAAVYVDDAFVATGEELERMVAPLALSQGVHRIEVVAPGYASRSEVIELQSGEVRVLRIGLTRAIDQGS